LIVEFSDDASMVGHRFEITKPVTSIGRSADNDINFPKDSPISRHHASIEARDDGLYISEVETPDGSGTPKLPTFGTFLNDATLGAAAHLLHNGDVIRLGKRVLLKFETDRLSSQEDVRTLDDLEKTTG
jgi:pSer/pThr/pTyr-binding forkhead associated (FHA) protein